MDTGTATRAAKRRRTSLALADVLGRLRAHESTLRQQGVVQLYVYGSPARGEAAADSDIDLFCDVDPDSPWSLVRWGSVWE